MIQLERKIDKEKYPLTYGFFKLLDMHIKASPAFGKAELLEMFKSLFLFFEIDDLELHLEFTQEEYAEHKKTGWWFTVFHKAFRQRDVFRGYFKEVSIDLLTKEEYMEMRRFKSEFLKKREEGFTKDDLVRDENGEFTKEYKRYLDLVERKKHQTREEPISGQLDGLMWNLIHVDREEKLMQILEELFEKEKDKNGKATINIENS